MQQPEYCFPHYCEINNLRNSPVTTTKQHKNLRILSSIPHVGSYVTPPRSLRWQKSQFLQLWLTIINLGVIKFGANRCPYMEKCPNSDLSKNLLVMAAWKF